MKQSSRSNIFLVFEGIDFAGKTTIAKDLSNTIGGKYIESPPEPFTLIKQEILEASPPLARFSFFISSNVQVAAITIGLLSRTHIVCDRYIWSTIAYHAALENVEPTHLLPFIEPYLDSIIMPEYVIFLAVNREIQLLRSRNRVIDDKLQHSLLLSDSFQQRLKKAYHTIKNFFGVPWIEIDTSDMSIPETTQEIMKNICRS